MSKNLMSSIKDMWDVVLPPLPKPSLMTGTAQTMLSWPKVITSIDEIPDAFKTFFKTWLGDAPEFPHVILSPTKKGFFNSSGDKLICEMNDTIYVVEQFRDRIIANGYTPENIRDVEVGAVLLHGWITIKGINKEGVPAVSIFLFNSAQSDMFAPFIAKIRSAPTSPDETALDKERAKLDYLSQLDFKFMNYARSSLIGGEQVIESVWQPEIQTTVGSVFGLSLTRTLSPAHLAMLTDKELILIKDEPRSRGNKGVRYGGIRHYIPLRSIGAVSLTEQANDLVALSIHLSEDENVDSLFTASKEKEVLQLKTEIEKLIVNIQ
ncbi:hypothetical protein QUF64_11490 [Anaerolineales bacterium HSG6]|nr:hypothetical protein [Anaerolineales bacterium HSG6]